MGHLLCSSCSQVLLFLADMNSWCSSDSVSFCSAALQSSTTETLCSHLGACRAPWISPCRREKKPGKPRFTPASLFFVSGALQWVLPVTSASPRGNDPLGLGAGGTCPFAAPVHWMGQEIWYFYKKGKAVFYGQNAQFLCNIPPAKDKALKCWNFLQMEKECWQLQLCNCYPSSKYTYKILPAAQQWGWLKGFFFVKIKDFITSLVNVKILIEWSINCQ